MRQKPTPKYPEMIRLTKTSHNCMPHDSIYGPYTNLLMGLLSLIQYYLPFTSMTVCILLCAASSRYTGKLLCRFVVSLNLSWDSKRGRAHHNGDIPSACQVSRTTTSTDTSTEHLGSSIGPTNPSATYVSSNRLDTSGILLIVFRLPTSPFQPIGFVRSTEPMLINKKQKHYSETALLWDSGTSFHLFIVPTALWNIKLPPTHIANYL